MYLSLNTSVLRLETNRKVEGAYSALFKHAQEHGLKTGTRAYEFYLNDPSKVKASELKTEVYMEIV